MMVMNLEVDERAKGVDLPSWWLEKVRELCDERKDQFGENLTELGERLAEAVGRAEPWDHSSVSRFLRNKNTTVPMAEAFAALLGIPRPFFVPRSFDEALSLQQVVARYDGKQSLTPDQRRRLAMLDDVADLAAREDQIDAVASTVHEGTSRSRRTGRSSRRR